MVRRTLAAVLAAAVVSSSCAVTSDAERAAEPATSTSPSSSTDAVSPSADAAPQTSAAPPMPSPVEDPAHALQGRTEFRDVMPTLNELADTLGGLWDIKLPTYFSPQANAGADFYSDRELDLLIGPRRCRNTGQAVFTGRTWRPAHEAVDQGATKRGWGQVSAGIEKYRTVSEADSELRRWQEGLASCRRFAVTTRAFENRPMFIDKLTTGSGWLTARAFMPSPGGHPDAGLYKLLVVRQAGSALVFGTALGVFRTDGVWVERSVSPRQLHAMAKVVIGRIARRTSSGPGQRT